MSTEDYLTPEEIELAAERAAEWSVGLHDSLVRAGYEGPDGAVRYLGAQSSLNEPERDNGADPGAVVWDGLEAAPVSVPRSQDNTLDGYLVAVRRFLCRYIAFPSEYEPIAVALWVAHAHLAERFETSPILAVTSAEMRSGKTRVLEVLELLVPNPFRVVIPSEAVTYTVLSQRPRPTMLLDEADAIFGPRAAERYEGLRAILNSGNRRGSPVLRVKLEGKRREVEEFDVFGPKAVAGIGDLPATVADRSIPIRMKRRSSGEPITKFRRRQAEAEAASIAYDLSATPLVTDVPVPEELPDRAADSWEPLLAIADAAGGAWPMQARLAATALSSEDQLPVSVGMRLLTDIRDAFGDEDHVTTAELLRRLHDLEDAPWADWYGSPLSGRGLAKLLGPYRVTPMQRRVGGEKSRGYFRSEFEDAFRRYVPGTGTSGTSGTPEPAPTVTVPDVPDVPVPREPCPTCQKPMVATPDGRSVCTNAPGHPARTTPAPMPIDWSTS